MTSPALARFATATATTKRTPAAVAGKIGAPTAKLSSLAIVPPLPASKEVIERYKLSSPVQVFTTYADGSPDVIEGDVLTTGGIDYNVRAVANWGGFLEIIIERVKA